MDIVKDLKDKMVLYHASYKIVDDIDLKCCRDGLDFGKGFYLTTSKSQAEHFIKNSVGRAILEKKIKKQEFGYINEFLYYENEDVRTKIFAKADREWLHFVAYNRSKNDNLRSSIGKYDIIGGKIANDLTAKTIAIYLSSGYGDIGSENADNVAINLLLPNKLKDQYCFLTKKALKNIRYERSYKYEIK